MGCVVRVLSDRVVMWRCLDFLLRRELDEMYTGYWVR